MADAGNAIKVLSQKALIAFGAIDRDLDEVIVLPGRQIGFEYLWQIGQCTPELVEDFVVVLLERDLDNDRVGLAQVFLVENSSIGLNVSALLEASHSLPAWTG